MTAPKHQLIVVPSDKWLQGTNWKTYLLNTWCHQQENSQFWWKNFQKWSPQLHSTPLVVVHIPSTAGISIHLYNYRSMPISIRISPSLCWARIHNYISKLSKLKYVPTIHVIEDIVNKPKHIELLSNRPSSNRKLFAGKSSSSSMISAQRAPFQLPFTSGMSQPCLMTPLRLPGYPSPPVLKSQSVEVSKSLVIPRRLAWGVGKCCWKAHPIHSA